VNNNLHPHQKEELAELAVIAMRERGLAPEFGPAVRQQLERIDGPAATTGPTSSTSPACRGARSTTTIRATWTSSPSARRCPTAA
jgi:hypothetical protein